MTAQDAVHPPTPQSCANEGLAGEPVQHDALLYLLLCRGFIL